MNNQNIANDHKEKGVVIILILMLAAALFILAAVAFKAGYSLHRHNRQAKVRLQQNADNLHKTERNTE